MRAWGQALAASAGAGAFEGDFSAQRFSNPVAYCIDRTARDVVSYLFSDDQDIPVPESINDACHVLALQDTSPSETLASFFHLRQIVFSRLAGDPDLDLLLQIDERIDCCMLAAADCLSQCREQILQLRIGELKRREKMLERYRETPLTEIGEG